MPRQVAFLLILFLFLEVAHAQGQLAYPNYTAQRANATVQNVSYYIAIVNESGYLIFEPNLTSANNYLTMAQGNTISNPYLAVAYANKAYNLTEEQYNSIEAYKSESLPFIVAFTAAMLILLYKFMIPIKRAKKKVR